MSKSQKKKAKTKARPEAGVSKPEKADVAAARAVAPYRHKPIVRAVAAIGMIGDQPPLRALSGATMVFGLFRGDRRLVRAGIRMLAAHTIATVVKDVIKHRVDRTRPGLLVEDGRYRMARGDDRSKEQSSFPSGHSAGAVAVARAFARDYPEHKVAANMAGAAIALAQIPRCAHFPSDVGVGGLIGLLSETLASRLVHTPASAETTGKR